MHLIILLSLAATWKTSILFYHNDKQYQDYFIFSGNSSTAQLFRANNTIKLLVSHLREETLYKYNATSLELNFMWPFLINGHKMNLQYGNENISISQFHNFTFYNPVAASQPEKYTQMLDKYETKYHYVIGVLLLLFALIESPGLIKQIIDKYRSSFTTSVTDSV